MKRTIAVTQLLVFASFLVWSQIALSQSVGSLQGQVIDSSGAAVTKALIEATDVATNSSESTETDSNGSYMFSQLRAGTYRVKAAKAGFESVVQQDVSVLVATPVHLDFKLPVGAVSVVVDVTGQAVPALNTEDATIGNTFDEAQVKSLPFLARNVVNLLTIQPGVVFTGRSDTDRLSMGSISQMDPREGVVDGIRGNQSNVTLDGMDSNDWFTQAAFTSAIPITLDSVQEFRVTTTNANATSGLVSGAQVQLATKSGSNEFHGNARWYYRTSGTAANSFFNNFNDIARPKLQRNIGGGSIGGPIKKNRLFVFLDNEERRDITATAPATIPVVASDLLRDGVLSYKCATASQCPGGTVQGLTASHTFAPGTFALSPAQFKSLDPAGVGVNPAMVTYMNGFPHGNDPTVGLDNGLNETGVFFNAPLATSDNTYIARVDYNLTENGHHTIAWRGNLQGLKTDITAEQFPGQSAAQQLLNNSRGYAILYTGQISPNLVNSARYGLTRVGVLTTGATGPNFNVRDYATNISFARGNDRIQPIHQIGDDVSWVRGQHTLQMGGNLYLVTTNRISDGNNVFPAYNVNNGFCVSLCMDVFNGISGNPAFPTPTNANAITRAAMMLTGSMTQVNATFLGNPATGAILPSGTPEARHFEERYVDSYVQDSWHFRPNVTFTYGLRWSYETPVWENTGNQVAPSTNIMAFLQQRIANMNAGIPSDASSLLSWSPAGKANKGADSWYRPDFKDFSPRLAVAYSPEWDGGIAHWLFGGPGKSSLRLGTGLFYDKVGQNIALDSDNSGSPGTATALINGSQQFTFATAPRFGGACAATGCTGLPAAASPFFTPPTSATFPFTPPPNVSGLGFAVDPNLRTPYSIHLTASFQRELPGRTVVEAAYVGTLGRRLLGKIDYGQYLNIRDPKSGVDLFSAFQQIAKIANVTPSGGPTISPTNVAALSTIQSIPFFDNMLPNMPAFLAAEFPKTAGYSTLTPTQAFYAFTVRAAAPSWSCALFPIDTDPSPGGIPSPWNTTVDPQRDGLVLFQQQFQSLPGWTNFANSNYHSLQLSVRKNTKNVGLAVNYVWSKGIDNDSTAENADFAQGGSTLSGLIQNPFNLRFGRGLSDFDLRHNINGDWTLQLPFGRGQYFGANANRLVDALIGGWEVVGTFRFHTGFPVSISDGFNFPTNFFLTTPGTTSSGLSTDVVTSGTNKTPAGAAIPNIFKDATAAFQLVGFTLPGLPGSRNTLRGPAYTDTDMGVNKTFKMPYNESHSIQFRVSAFNVFNQVNFSTVTIDPTAPGTFGNFTATAGPRGGAREMEFAARYQF